MADEQYRWLDRETAERLLSGEPLEAVDAAARAQAEQLAETLGALSAQPPPTGEELPGEAAALAAFRKVRAERDATLAGVGTPAAGPSRPAGAVRPGRRTGRDRRRWGRPARLGLAAALAAGMLGGVAVAAGTGVLPSPFRTGEPEPTASVSATGPGAPLSTPPSDGSGRRDGATGGSPGGDGRGEADGDGRGTGEGASPGEDRGSAGERAERIASVCRDLRDGEEVSADRRRDLEEAAGGASRVSKYCENVLAGGNAAEGGNDAGRGNAAEDGAGSHDEQGGTGNGGGTGAGPDAGSGAGSGSGSGGSGQGGDKGRGDPGGRAGQAEQGDRGGRSGRTGAADESAAAGGNGRRTDGAAAAGPDASGASAR